MVWLRRGLWCLLVFGLSGTLAELVLLEHHEDIWQWIPIVSLSASLLLALCHRALGRVGLRLLQVLMACCIAAGIHGLYLHYTGNAEFELEMYPTRKGWELFWESMKGATPALAPLSMCYLGILGLLYSSLRRRDAPTDSSA